MNSIIKIDRKKHNTYISFHSKKIFYDLEKYGVVPNKTFKLNKLPNIPLQYMHHFIRDISMEMVQFIFTIVILHHS